MLSNFIVDSNERERKVRIYSTCKLSVKNRCDAILRTIISMFLLFYRDGKGSLGIYIAQQAKDCLIPLQIVYNKSVNKTHEDSAVQNIVFKAL